MEYLLVLNDSPYGSQRTYNALRLAGALAKGATMGVSIFLLGDGVVSGLRMQSHLGRPSHLDRGSNEGVSVLIDQSDSARPKAFPTIEWCPKT